MPGTQRTLSLPLAYRTTQTVDVPDLTVGIRNCLSGVGLVLLYPFLHPFGSQGASGRCPELSLRRQPTILWTRHRSSRLPEGLFLRCSRCSTSALRTRHRVG